MERTLYTIETRDGFHLEYITTDGLVGYVKYRDWFDTETELLQWVSDNIELIGSYTATILEDNIHGTRS
jgi:hypothetical protein